MPFCPNCASESEVTHRFCRQCGAALVAPESSRQTMGSPSVPGMASQALPYYLSPTHILVMTLLSAGLYFFYWFYLTWKQYRDHTGLVAFPIWHALTLLVPVYGLFRTHAHIRSFKELMENSGVPCTLSVGWAVGLVAIAGVLDGISFNISGGFTGAQQISQATSLVIALLGAVSIAVVTGLLLQVQENLNRYWSSRPEVLSGALPLTSAKIGVVEIVLLVLGLLTWLDTLLLLFSPEFRAGSF